MDYDDIQIADLALENTFIFVDKYEMERCEVPVHFDSKIDWLYIPFGDVEWNYAFNRHTFLHHLAKAWSQSQEEKYKEGFIRLITDFIDNCPFAENSAWRSLETGIRIQHWLSCLKTFPLDVDVKQKIEASLITHRDHLLASHKDFHRLSNWGVLQDQGLFLLGLYFKDEELKREALSRLDEEMSLQILPDGSHWEQSPMYQAQVLSAALDVLEQTDQAPARLLENTSKAALGLKGLSRPDGTLFLSGDSDEIEVNDLFARAEKLFGKIQEKKAYLFPYSGNYLFRTQKGCVRFKSGFAGSGHGHADQLHVDLFVNGQPVLTDAGRLTYKDSEERHLLKGAFSHNTVIVDSLDMMDLRDSWNAEGVPLPLKGQCVTGEEVDYVEASHLGYLRRSVVLRRKVIRLGERYLILTDEFYGEGSHEYETLFHFAPEGRVSILKDGVEFSSDKAYVKVITIPKTELSLSKYKLSKHYNETLSASLITFKERAEGFARMIHVIAYDEKPFDFTVSFPPVFRAGITDDASAIVISDDKEVFTLIIRHKESQDGAFLLKAGGAEGYGALLLKKNEGRTHVIV